MGFGTRTFAEPEVFTALNNASMVCVLWVRTLAPISEIAHASAQRRLSPDQFARRRSI